MGRRTLIVIPALAVAALVASLHACGSSTPQAQLDGGTVCAHGSSSPCPAGNDCINSICTTVCDGGTACGAGFYCTADQQTPEAVCAPTAAPKPCATLYDCPSPQRCFHGVCASIEPQANGSQRGCLAGAADDLCGTDAVCSQITDPATGALLNDCLGLPQCAQDGTCPVGDLGSVCNDGRQLDGGQLFPGKQRLCLVGFCTRDTDCAAGTACFVRSPGKDALGNCTNGKAGNNCLSQHDCFNATNCYLADGGIDPGDGGVVGICQ